jgi:hypothetical protein
LLCGLELIEIMLSWPNLKCYVDWKWCDRKLSQPIWSIMWIRTDDRGWCNDLIWGALWTTADCELMLSWINLKCYVDWKGCDRKISRPIWRNLRIKSEDLGWCHDLIWGGMWIGIDDIWCCLNQIYIFLCVLERKRQELSRSIWNSMLVRTYDTRWCLDLNWGALLLLEQMRKMLSLCKLKCYVDWKGCDKKISWQIWSKM